jgi:uncharacterized protein YdeI (YjbR/CyaY-like superfamily)
MNEGFARPVTDEVVKPTFFATADAFRRWLEANHRSVNELWIGFYKAHTGKAGLNYAQAVDEALCFGWIDGLKKRFDDAAFMQRFTPRRSRSIWSDVNTRRVEALEKAGRMAPSGLEAFRARDPTRAGLYSFENRDRFVFDAAAQKRFRAKQKAWAFFEAQPPGYQRTATFWVASAKRDQTRERRLAQLMDASARGERLGMLSGNGTRRPKA